MDPEPNLYFILFQNTIDQPSGSILFSLLFFVVLLICSGLISASEVAYFSLGLKDVKDLEEENTSASQRILALKEKPRYLLATILIANNFVNIAIVIVAEQLLREFIGESSILMAGQWLHNNLLYGFTTPETIANVFNFLITVVGVTFILVWSATPPR